MMNRIKPVILDPKSRSFCFELIEIMKGAGLIPYDEANQETLYFTDSQSKRHFRVLEGFYLEVSDDSFDRWANSSHINEPLPFDEFKIIKLVERLRVV